MNNIIGFKMQTDDDKTTGNLVCKGVIYPKKCIAEVYFPSRRVHYSYYNDEFELKEGDWVYVDGKLAGIKGYVTNINYSFKIKLSDYKKVIALIDITVTGDFYLTPANIIAFDKGSIPYSKVINWFKAYEDEEYVCGDDESVKFPLDDLSKMNISKEEAEMGYDYFLENDVCYVELNKTKGRAIVEGSKYYEIEFKYKKGEISNLKCSCYKNNECRHEFAVMLKLKETLDFILKNYEKMYSDYFAIISKNVFIDTIMNGKTSGKISLGV